MKQFLISIFILLFTFQTTYCQVIEPTTDKTPQELYNFHLLKQKRNKNTAWTLAGTGVALIMVGGLIQGGEEFSADIQTTFSFGNAFIEPERKGDWLYYVGGVVAAASVPFFISSSKHKRKAKLSFKEVQNKVGNIKFDNSNYMAVGITIPF